MGNFFVHVLEYAGDNDYGGHWFSDLPVVNSIVHLQDGLEARVQEVHFVEADPDLGAGEVVLYVLSKQVQQ